MSGYKRATVTISEQEYRRLHDADMKRRFGRNKQEKQDTGQTHLKLSNILQMMESRQRQLEDLLGNVDRHFSRIEAETMQNIIMQNAICYDSLSAVIEETAAYTSDSIASMSQFFEDNMLREREHYRQNIHMLVRQIDEHRQKEFVKEQSARQWLKRAVMMTDFIQEQFDHQRYIPGRLHKIQQSLELAQNNLAEGFFEASLQLSQQTYLELSELHFDLEQRMVQSQAQYERAFLAARQVLADIEAGRQVYALGMQGEELPEMVDINYWTNGKYSALLNKCHMLLEYLKQDTQRISTEDISRVFDEIVPTIRKSFENIVYEARLNVLNSHLRMNIAEKAQQALEKHGYRLCEEGYAERDMRASYKVQLDNQDGTQVTIQVIPKEETDQEMTNDLVVITEHPYLKTEQEARMKWEEIRETLSHYNLNISQFQTHPQLPERMDNREQPILQTRQPAQIQRKNNVR
jgi:hypothetical protein